MVSSKAKQIKEIVIGIKESHSFLSLEELIESIGINFAVVPSDLTILDGDLACYFKLNEKEHIYLSEACPKEQETFVLAHELGHAILHDVEMAHCGYLYKSRKLEEEADYFAIKLLEDNYELFEGYTSSDYVSLYGIRETATEYTIRKEEK